MKNKRIEVTAQEREALKRMKTRAQYATSEFEDMSWIKNGAAKMFGYYTSKQKKRIRLSWNFLKTYSK